VLAISGIEVATLAIAAIAALSAIAAAALTIWGARRSEQNRWIGDARKVVYATYLAKVIAVHRQTTDRLPTASR
jgi:hypothetical protein